MNMDGMQFNCKFAKINDMYDFQDDSGKSVNIVEVSTFGSTNNIIVDQETARKVRPLKGCAVSVEGDLLITRKSNGSVSCKMSNVKFTEIKG